METLRELLTSLDLNDDLKFGETVATSIYTLRMEKLEKEIIYRFDLTKPTFNCWIKGKASPHPVMRKHIINFFIKKLDEAELLLGHPIPSDNGWMLKTSEG